MTPPWISVENNQHQQVRCFDSVEKWQQERIETPTFWLVLRNIKLSDIPIILPINNTELVLLCNPTGLKHNSPRAKELIRCINRLQKLYSLSEKRLHLLINSSECSPSDAHMLVVLGEKIGCNVKIGKDFPQELYVS